MLELKKPNLEECGKLLTEIYGSFTQAPVTLRDLKYLQYKLFNFGPLEKSKQDLWQTDKPQIPFFSHLCEMNLP